MYIDGKVTSINDDNVTISDYNGNKIEYHKPKLLSKTSKIDDCIRVFISNNTNCDQYRIVSIDKINNKYKIVLDDETTIYGNKNEFSKGDNICISYQHIDHITEPTDF